MKKWIMILVGSVMLLSFSVTTAAAEEWKDILGTMNDEDVGTQKMRDSFKPYEEVSRGLAAYWLAETFEMPEDYEPAVHKFKDVPETSPYYKHIHFLAERNVIKGETAERYNPSKILNREQSMALLYRAFYEGEQPVSTKTKFKDANKISTVFVVPVAYLIENTIVKGTPSNEIMPKAQLKESQWLMLIDRTKKDKGSSSYSVLDTVGYEVKDVQVSSNKKGEIHLITSTQADTDLIPFSNGLLYLLNWLNHHEVIGETVYFYQNEQDWLNNKSYAYYKEGKIIR